MITVRSVVRSIVVTLVATTAAGAGLLAQQALTRTPTPAPGFTNVVVTAPVRAAQEGVWTTRASQEGAWTMKVADLPLRTIAEQPAPSFIRAQKTYLLQWGSGASGRFSVTEIRPDGWVRATTTEGGRSRGVWINTRVLAVVEELP